MLNGWRVYDQSVIDKYNEVDRILKEYISVEQEFNLLPDTTKLTVFRECFETDGEAFF